MAAIDHRPEDARPDGAPVDVHLSGQQAEAYSLVFERLAHSAHDKGDEHRAVVLALRALRLLADAGDPSPSFPGEWFAELGTDGAVQSATPRVEPERART